MVQNVWHLKTWNVTRRLNSFKSHCRSDSAHQWRSHRPNDSKSAAGIKLPLGSQKDYTAKKQIARAVSSLRMVKNLHTSVFFFFCSDYSTVASFFQMICFILFLSAMVHLRSVCNFSAAKKAHKSQIILVWGKATIA